MNMRAVEQEIVDVVKEVEAADREFDASAEWLTREQVRGLCASCADDMAARNVTKIKASALFAKLDA